MKLQKSIPGLIKVFVKLWKRIDLSLIKSWLLKIILKVFVSVTQTINNIQSKNARSRIPDDGISMITLKFMFILRISFEFLLYQIYYKSEVKNIDSILKNCSSRLTGN